jgi:hypothetical protein
MAKPRSRKSKTPSAKKTKPDQMKAVGDSFTMPTEEHEYLTTIKTNCLNKSIHVTKSDVIRVGLLLARNLSTAEFLKLWKTLPRLSPGRPRKTEDEK